MTTSRNAQLISQSPLSSVLKRPEVLKDPRYSTLLFRYRARHYPHTLNEEERQRWQEFVARKLDFDTGLAGLTLEQYEDVLTARRAQEPDPARRAILDALQAWPRESGLLELLGL